MTYDEAFAKLSNSAFRRRFRLDTVQKSYIAEKGAETIRRHAADFVRTRLAPARPPNDGRQTPMRGHPVFTAQHATALCCRGCMNKWWRVPLGVELSEVQQARAVDFIMKWIDLQLQDR